MSNTVTLSFKPQWEGIVKIDDSFDDYASNISEYGNYKQITIEDVKYHNLAYATFDHVSGIQNFPNIITIMVFGNNIHQFMKCKAVLGYQEIAKTKGLIRKKTYYEDVLRTKGFNLESIDESQTEPLPILGAYRANIGGDNSFDIKQRGLASFGTASHSAKYSSSSARHSITCVFVASDQAPFKAIVRKKGKIYDLTANTQGIIEKSLDKDSESQPKPSKDDPLHILNIRLAKGEITKEEYEDLKSILE